MCAITPKRRHRFDPIHVRTYSPDATSPKGAKAVVAHSLPIADVAHPPKLPADNLERNPYLIFSTEGGQEAQFTASNDDDGRKLLRIRLLRDPRARGT
jgi:hypothetical protein